MAIIFSALWHAPLAQAFRGDSPTYDAPAEVELTEEADGEDGLIPELNEEYEPEINQGYDVADDESVLDETDEIDDTTVLEDGDEFDEGDLPEGATRFFIST